MSPLNLSLQNARSIVAVLSLMGLWFLLYLSLQSGDIRDITNPGSKYGLLQAFRATLPLIAASVAVVILATKLLGQRPGSSLFLGPLGLLAVYGLVGVIASTQSPSGFVSLYWSVSFLSVPLVLWAIVWRSNNIDWIGRVVTLNWLVLIFASASLFAFGLIYLNLGSFISSPGNWLDCSPQAWLEKTSHFIRSTGVGRYAALAGIISLSRLWHPRWRSLWGLIFVASMILLLYSGARTAMVGFGVAVPVIVLLSGGKRAALGILIVGVVLTPVFWTTGIHSEFFDNCIFRRASSSGPSLPAVPEPSVPSLADSVVQITPVPDEPNSAGPVVQITPVPDEPSPYDLISNGSDHIDIPLVGAIPRNFFNFSGRTIVWRNGIAIFKGSPILGRGFHADRLLLRTHAHNSLVHSLIQTGLAGTIPFVAGVLFAWALLIRTSLNLARLSQEHKLQFIQVAGVLAFLSLRSVTESTGAFFGVDWLLLGPILLFLQVVNSRLGRNEATSQ